MDTNLTLRTGATDLTADETLTSVHIGPMTRPLYLHVVVPSITSTDTLDVELEFCDAATSTTEVYNQNMKQITAAGYYSTPFYTDEEYLQVKLNVTDVGGSGFSAGAVKVWIAPAHRYDKPYNA
jgi:hypothetical protein